MIAKSRREGKNRRDGATVSTRVLRLTETIGRGLFEGEEGGKGRLSEEDNRLLEKQRLKRQALQTRAHL